MAEAQSDERLQPLLKNPVGDGSVSLLGRPLDRNRTGAWKSAPFIYVLIFADTISVLGIAGNLVTYARGTLHLSIAESANTATNFMGFAYLLPLFWGFLADSYFGRFWIIAFGSLASLGGLVVLTFSTSIPSLQPPTCTPTDEHPVCEKASPYVLGWFYSALFLVSVGSAGLKPCMLSMGQDQFDDTDPKEKKQGANFFTGYYVLLNLSSMFCVTVLFYLQSNVSFPRGYASIAGMYILAISIFFLGTPYFRHMKPGGSTLTRAARVLVAAVKNSKKTLPPDADELYELPDETADAEGIRKIIHTRALRCLDKAAIITGSGTQEHAVNKQVSCTVTQVEELKSIIQIAPIWMCLILVFTLYAQVMGVGVQQASTLDRRVGPYFTIPPGSSVITLMLGALAFIVVYEYLLVPLLAKITGHPQGLSPLRKIGVALFLAILAMIVAANIESMRVQSAKENRSFLRQTSEPDVPMSVWWLVPQFVLLGWVEVLLGVAQLHFLYRETPDSMRSLAISLTFTTISIGYFVSTGLVSAVNKFTAGTGGWLAEEFDTGGLKKFYYLLSAIMSINLLIFIALARGYTYKKLQPRMIESDNTYSGRAPFTPINAGGIGSPGV